jgi:hypothetical protein
MIWLIASALAAMPAREPVALIDRHLDFLEHG